MKPGWILALVASAVFAQITVRMEAILPRSTDPAIDSALSAHRAALASGVALRNRLFLFLHGGGGTANGSGEVVKTAAEQGFHAIAVTYPMNVLPSQFCSGPATGCQENFRREILEGADYSPYISISRANGVENRVVKLLRTLDSLHPGENWTQFDSGGVPLWSATTVYGHSMGAANAALLAKLHALPRVCLSGPATDIPLWWANPATPPDRIFGFSHAQDPMFTGQQAGWTALGLNPLGPLTDAALSVPPYGATHSLLATLAPAIAGDFHNSPSMDGPTPRDSAGVPVYKPVWIYMMGPAAPTPVLAGKKVRPHPEGEHSLDVLGRKIPLRPPGKGPAGLVIIGREKDF